MVAALMLAVAVLCPTVAVAQLLPAGMLERTPNPDAGIQVEADYLTYDARTREVSAEGQVIVYADGNALTADRVTYNRATGDVFAEGNVVIRDPDGILYSGDRIKVTDRMRSAFIESLTLTTPDGAQVTATEVDYERELITILTNASYSPCGLCIDEKGRRIGWRVKASKFIHDRERALVFLESPTLELLGIPMAWLPWMVVPDPSQPRAQGFRMPTVDFDSEKLGVRLEVPYFIPVSRDIDLVLSPTLMSRQGLLMAASWVHRVPLGTYDVAAAGVYQLDPLAFSGDGQTEWRGAIQTTGTFTPVKDWTAGWSYTAFTDPAFLTDYQLRSSKNSVNQVYATYLTEDTYLDVRLRQYNILNQTTQARQARQIPSVEAAHYSDFGEFGRVELYGRLLNVQRESDHTRTVNGVPYVFGLEGNKGHAMVEGAWQKQFVLPGGVLATPYAGLRIDAASYDGASALGPGEVSLLEATPIAAMDFRWPLVAAYGADSHLFEPIAQVVYRGSTNSMVGIVNDDAQSFVFDDSLLFSYNRFSGIDRQETGLRANVGGRYLADFADGSWLQLIAGQSFHFDGVNAFGVVDQAQTGNSSGLENDQSYIVLGAQGSLGGPTQLGAKAQIDPAAWQLMRLTAAAKTSFYDYSFGASYTFIPADVTVGTIEDQQEVTGNVSGPLPFDYWSADASLSWDVAQNSFLAAKGGITYDDGYLLAGAFAGLTGATHSKREAFSFGLQFRLRGPDMQDLGVKQGWDF